MCLVQFPSPCRPLVAMNITPMRLIVVAALTLLFVHHRLRPAGQITVTVDIPVRPTLLARSPSPSARSRCTTVSSRCFRIRRIVASAEPRRGPGHRGDDRQWSSSPTLRRVPVGLLRELAARPSWSSKGFPPERRCGRGAAPRVAPFALAFEDTALGRVAFAFGDRDSLAASIGKTRRRVWSRRQMESGIDEEEAWTSRTSRSSRSVRLRRR